MDSSVIIRLDTPRKSNHLRGWDGTPRVCWGEDPGTFELRHQDSQPGCRSEWQPGFVIPTKGGAKGEAEGSDTGYPGCPGKKKLHVQKNRRT